MEVREKIIQSAGGMFLKFGIRQVTMDNIAQALSISKRTIYENFKDKNDLLYTFIVAKLTEHKKKSLNILRGSQNVIVALFEFEEFNQNIIKTISPNFFDDLKKYHNDLYERIMGDESIRNYDVTFMILKRGINEGTFRKEIDIEIANLYIHNSMDFFHRMVNEKKYNPVKLWKTTQLPYLRGICTEKGQTLLNEFEKNKHNNE